MLLNLLLLGIALVGCSHAATSSNVTAAHFKTACESVADHLYMGDRGKCLVRGVRGIQ